MEPIAKFMFEHFLLIFAFAVIWNVIAVGLLLWKRHKKGLKFPKLSSTEIAFQEKFASGSSHKSLMTRLGGASNCLTLIVTDHELWITTFFPFTAFAGMFDLEHRISLGDIVGVERNGRRIDVEFKRPDRTIRKVSLHLRKASEFLRAVNDTTNTEQGAAADPDKRRR